MVSASETGGFGAGVKGGTLGAGVEITYAISPRLTMGVGINKYSTSGTETTDGIDYDVDLDLQTVAVLANFHPFAGSFRFTAGVMINSNELNMTANPDGLGNYNINGTDYNIAQVGTLKAAVDFNRIAPYAGIGFGHSASSGLGFTLDVGVLMQGSPNVDLTSTGGSESNLAYFQAELAQEAAAAEDDIKGFTMYPVVSAGLNFRF
jgi:hypothetical protein